MEDLDVLVDYQKSELINSQGLLTDFYAGQRDFVSENGKPLSIQTHFFKTVFVAQIHIYQAEKDPVDWVRVDNCEYKLDYSNEAEGGHKYAALHFDKFVEKILIEVVSPEEHIRAVRFLGDKLVNDCVETNEGDDWRDHVTFE